MARTSELEAVGSGQKESMTSFAASMKTSTPYAVGAINHDRYDKLVALAEKNESCCRCCGMRLGENDLVRAVPLPFLMPCVAHSFASEVVKEAERHGLPDSVTELMDSQHRALCYFSLAWIPGIIVGACLKRVTLNSASVLKTYRAVYTNPALYDKTSPPDEAAERYTLQMYTKRSCSRCC